VNTETGQQRKRTIGKTDPLAGGNNITENPKAAEQGTRCRLEAQTTANTVTPDKEKSTRAVSRIHNKRQGRRKHLA
jgi:hypothetical protein